MSKTGWIILLIVFILVLCISIFLVIYGVKKYHDDNSNKEIDRVLYIIGGVLGFISVIIIGLSVFKLVSMKKNTNVVIKNEDTGIEMKSKNYDMGDLAPPEYMGPMTPRFPPQGFPPQGFAPQGFPQGFAPQGYPPQGFPPQGYGGYPSF
jgi:hypothetical protein